MPWHAQLDLDYRPDPHAAVPRTVAVHRHHGPLRILQSLYPEGPATCHNVLVHPPSGLVAGDVLDVRVHAAAGTHGLLTTPGATRFYRSDCGTPARQQVRLALEAGARLEWLPLEAICYDGCEAHNSLALDIAPGAQCMGWDVAAFGLPAAAKPFLRGALQQQLHWPGVWLERGRIAAADTALMDGPLGLAGHRCLATLWLAHGTALTRPEREAALDAARAVIVAHPLAATAGATSPDARLVLVRVLADVVEPAMHLLRGVRDAWRSACWGLPAHTPRLWSL